METNEVFEEWNIYATKKPLIDREMNLNSLINNANTKIVAITGVRRCGKSSLLMLLAQKLRKEGQKVSYVNLEDSRIKDDKEILDRVIKWFGDEGYLLLDEITSATDWEGWLARTHELLKGKLRLIVSSSRKNLVHPAKPLRGRILPFELYPLSFREFLAFKGISIEKTTVGRGRIERGFNEYLKYGGFPEVVLTEEEVDKVRILNSYFKDIIGLDVAEISRQDVSTVDIFGKYVIRSPYFSASKCLNFFKTVGHKIGKEKILQLEKYAEAGYLFFFIPIFSYNIKDKSQYPRKAFAGDSGFYYSMTGKFEIGRLYESVALLELRRRCQGQREISYWKNREEQETDFVIKQGNAVEEIIQVAYDITEEKTRKRELNSLIESAKELKPSKALVLTKDIKTEKTFERLRIRFTPLIDWLLME